MPILINMPVVYECTGVPPKARTEQKFHARRMATFAFQQADPSDLLPALRYVHYDPRLPDGRAATEIAQWQGMLLRPASRYGLGGFNGPLTEDDLASMGGTRMPDCLIPPEKPYAYKYRLSTAVPAERLKPGRVSVDGFPEAAAAMQRHIDRNIVVSGGVVHQRPPDPGWEISHWADRPLTARATMAPSATFTLPADRFDLVEELGRWTQSELGRTLEVDRSSDIEVLAPGLPLSANPLVDAALAFAGRAELNVVNSEPWGPEVQALGTAFVAEQTPGRALAFMEAFEREATAPGAAALSSESAGSNAYWFRFFRKIAELLPPGFAAGHEDEDLLLQEFRAGP